MILTHCSLESTVLEYSVKNTVERQNFGLRKSYKLGFLGAEPDVFNTRSGTGSIFHSPGPMGSRGQEGHGESEAKAGTLMSLQEL